MSSHTPSDSAFQWQDLGPARLAGTRSFSLASKAVDQTFTIDVALPPFQTALDRSLPVVFVLDGDHTFATVAQTARSLQIDRAGLPPMLIVGIGYRPTEEGAVRAPLGLRTRDLTPSDDARYVAMLRAAPPPFTLPDDIRPGGAGRFLSFIKEELGPFLATQFAVDPDDQTIVGMSLGGLFALHVLFTAPRAFRRYVVASPAIWWDDGLLFREEIVQAALADDLNANVFLCAGAREEMDEPSARMVSNLAAMAAVLGGRAYPSLNLVQHLFEGEGHLSVYPAAVSRGLRAVFDRNANAAAWATLPPA